jgi:hypothetical protein
MIDGALKNEKSAEASMR